MKSTSPSAQRKFADVAAAVTKRKMASAHLSKDLRKQYKRRSVVLKKGDEVKIMNGKFVGKSGTIEEINYKNLTVTISGIKLKKTVGTEKNVPVHVSNLLVMAMDLSDKARQKVLLRKVKELKFEPKKEEVKPAAEKKDATAAKPAAKPEPKKAGAPAKKVENVAKAKTQKSPVKKVAKKE